MASSNRTNRLIIGVIVAAMIAMVALALTKTIPNVSSSAVLDDQTLEAIALKWAQVHGLQGNPIAKQIVHMTLGQWMALQGAELTQGAIQFGMSPDMPVFILAIRGNVVGQQSPLPGQTAPEQYDNIIVAISVRNGDLITVRTARDPSTMPIQVPLNVLTPTAPIKFASTQPPVTPPTLAPMATLTPTPTPMQSVLPTPTVKH